MIVLDTNVVSETMRPTPNAKVVLWLDSQPTNDLYVCTPVLAEICYGICLLRQSARKTQLLQSYGRIVAGVFEGRVLTFDTLAAEAYGEIVAVCESKGKPISVIDAMIAAIARSNKASLATRNTAHFAQTELPLINPFDVA
jgi:predicted nucleic acid-binding protein